MTVRKTVKKIVKLLFLALATPLYLLFLVLARIGQEDSAFQGFSQALSLIPGKLGTYLRAAFYKLTCPGTSDEISVGFLTIFSHRDTTIERGVYIGPQCNIGKCTIGANTLIGSGVHILSGNKQHKFDDINTPIQEQGGTYEKILVGQDCWIGNGALILANICNKCIIATGSVLTKATSSPLEIYAGNPAKLIRKRIDQDTMVSTQSREQTP